VGEGSECCEEYGNEKVINAHLFYVSLVGKCIGMPPQVIENKNNF